MNVSYSHFILSRNGFSALCFFFVSVAFRHSVETKSCNAFDGIERDACARTSYLQCNGIDEMMLLNNLDSIFIYYSFMNC